MAIDLIEATEKWAPNRHRSSIKSYCRALNKACKTDAVFEKILNTIWQYQGLWKLPEKSRDRAERSKYEYEEYWKERKQFLESMHGFLKDLEQNKAVEEVDMKSFDKAFKYEPEPIEWPRNLMRAYKVRGRPGVPYRGIIILGLCFKIKALGIKPLYSHLADILYYFFGIERVDIKREVMRLKKNASLVAHLQQVQNKVIGEKSSKDLPQESLEL